MGANRAQQTKTHARTAAQRRRTYLTHLMGFSDGCTEVAIRHIRDWQKNTQLILPRAPFARLCREILYETTTIGRVVDRMQDTALIALQEAAETFLVSWLEGELFHFF